MSDGSARPTTWPVFLGMTRPAMMFGVTFGSFLLLCMGTVFAFLLTKQFWTLGFFVPGYITCYLLCLRDPRIFGRLRVRATKAAGGADRFWGGKSYAPSRPRLPKTALRRLRHGRRMNHERCMDRFVPYTAHVDAHTVATKDGQLLQTLEVQGISFETLDDDDLRYRIEVLNTFLRSLGPRFALYHHVRRRRVQTELAGTFLDEFSAELDRRWQERLASARLYENVHYLTIVRRPLPGAVGRAAHWGQTFSSAVDRAAALENAAADRKALEDAVSSALSILEPFQARRLGVYAGPVARCSELLELLFEILNQEKRPVALPAVPLDRYLGAKRLTFGRETFEIRGATREDVQLGAIVTIKEYCAEVGPGFLNSLLRLPHELWITQSFGLVPRQRALNALKLQGRQMRAAEDDAISLRAQLLEATDAVASGQVVFGEHHWSVLVTGRTKEELDQGVSDVTGELATSGVIAERADVLTLEPAFWAQLPGNCGFIADPALVSSANFACFASFHNFPRGRAEGHWGPVTHLETTAGTRFTFQYQHQDVGNFTVIGPTGSGKTVLLSFLLAQSQRLGTQSVLLDKDRGSEIFVRAVGGTYRVIRPGQPTGLAPLQSADPTFLCSWVGLLVRHADGRPLSVRDREVIADAVAVLCASPPELRRLANLQQLLRGHEVRTAESLADRLGVWFGEGDRAWVFDHARDDLAFDARVAGIDLTYILGDPLAREAVLSYLFYRIDQKLDGRRMLIFLEEAWRFVDDPLCKAQLRDWLKTIRKRNGVLGFGSQSAQDALGSGIADSIVEQSPTQLWLPNPKASAEAYCKGWGLSGRELEWVRTLPDTSRCFLVKQGRESVVARLDLSGMDDLLCVLSGRQQTVARLDALRAELGDDPKDWMPRLLEETR
jgi:type IV secretion system protein VirB4